MSGDTAVRACVLRSLMSASAANELVLIRDEVVPAIQSLDWGGFANAKLVLDVATEISKWKGSLSCFTPQIFVCLADTARPGGEALPNAYELASTLSGKCVDDSQIGRNHARLAASCGLLVDPKNFTPQEFTNECKKRRLTSGQMDRYLDSARARLLLFSKNGSLKPMASALRSWGKFCDSVGALHFPVDGRRAAQFAATCRDPGTYGQYMAHLKTACELVGVPTDWFSQASVPRARDGLRKAAMVFKGPRLALKWDLVSRLVIGMERCIPEKFFCLLSWVFFLRARSEASCLVRAGCISDLNDRFKEIDKPGVIGRINDEVVIRLRSRKNRIGGDMITRGCVCVKPDGVTAHVGAALCPVHVLWPWVESRIGPGAPIFHDGIANSATLWLKIALEARDIPYPEKYTLHSLRRGAAQTLLEKGGDLHTLLPAGGWRSSAFRSYLDLMGLENSVVSASINALIDLDGED